MDFRQSNSAPVSRPEPVAGAAPVAAPQHSGRKMDMFKDGPKWLSILNVVILFGVAILLTLIALSFARSSNSSSSEGNLISKTQYQAVFLNNGQVYFGNVTALNSQYLRMSNIYYLTQNSSTGSNNANNTNGDYTLVKLGCQQIHDPTDQMVINRSQVTFWENLNKDGKVAQSIEQFKKQNPNGPDCSKVTNQTQSSSNANTQGSTSPAKP